MKTNHINRMARVTGMSVALALFAGIVGTINAQNGARGGATKLVELSRGSITAKAQPSDFKPMSCAQCKNTTIAVRDTEARGLGAKTLVAGGAPTKLVTTHECKGCGTDWAVVGIGRAKESVATHKCTSCGGEALACCNTKQSASVATKGMEKKFEVAPLK